MKKIGILTSGGDCQGLNAAIRGVAKGLYEEIDDVEITVFKTVMPDLSTVITRR